MQRHAFTFPLRRGDVPKKVRTDNSREETFVIVASSEGRAEQLAGKASNGEWITVFSSPCILVREKRSRRKNSIPLRFGLEAEERSKLVQIARTAIEQFVNTGSQRVAFDANSVPARLNLKTDVDVALFVNGHLRGSTIIEGTGLAEGVAHAAVRSCIDARFKPIGADEIGDLWIEITVMRDLHITLSLLELRKDRIYFEKGYMLISEGHKGYFLPEVHNVTKFSSLFELRLRLASEKAGVAPSIRAPIAVFEVEDFIASPESTGPMPLSGPVVNKVYIDKFDNVLAVGHAAAEWLGRIQESDGNFPPTISAVCDTSPRVDFARLAFTAWSLAAFSAVTKNDLYRDTAQKVLVFLKKYLVAGKRRVHNESLALAYTGQLARTIDDENLSVAIERTMVQMPYVSADTITIAQVASFLSGSREGIEKAEALRHELRARFERGMHRKENMDLAVFAELVNVFHVSDPIFSNKVVEWLINQQKNDGSFPQSTTSAFSYTRGTGKIFEVLALAPHDHEKQLFDAVNWLSNMQYDEQNLFFVIPQRHDVLRGGFRHDYQNPDAWIDAAGHVLLGISRIMHTIERL